MPQCCVVPKCSSKRIGHRFPKDKVRLRQWLIAIHRRDFSPSKNSIVCIDHFKKDDYETVQDSEAEKPKQKLKPTAVPSTFSWSKGIQRKATESIKNTENGKLQNEKLDKVKTSLNSLKTESSSQLTNTDISLDSKHTPHKHVLKLVHSNKYTCDVCHKVFTRLSQQVLPKDKNVKIPVPPDKVTVQRRQKGKCKKFVQEDETSKSDSELEDSPKRPRTSNTKCSCICGQNFTSIDLLHDHRTQHKHYSVSCGKTDSKKVKSSKKVVKKVSKNKGIGVYKYVNEKDEVTSDGDVKKPIASDVLPEMLEKEKVQYIEVEIGATIANPLPEKKPQLQRPKSYSCEICGKSYPFPSRLNYHRATHTKNHECETCKKKFSTVNHLERHLCSNKRTLTALKLMENFKLPR